MFSFVSGLESRDFGHGLYVSLARWYSEVFKAAPRRWKMVEMYENSAWYNKVSQISTPNLNLLHTLSMFDEIDERMVQQFVSFMVDAGYDGPDWLLVAAESMWSMVK